MTELLGTSQTLWGTSQPSQDETFLPRRKNSLMLTWLAMAGIPEGLSADSLRFRADTDLLQVEDVELRIGTDITDYLPLLRLRKGRAARLTRRIHVFFCALAAARMYRPDGWISIDEIGALEGWSHWGTTSVAKLLANEFELGVAHECIVELHGRGSDARVRLRMPPALVELGQLPDSIRRLFARDTAEPSQPSDTKTIEDLRPQPVLEQALAARIASALRSGGLRGRPLLVSPLYQSGNSSLVFSGLEVCPPTTPLDRAVTTSVLVKLPVGVTAGNALTVHQQTLDEEIRRLSELAARRRCRHGFERCEVDLRPIEAVLAEHHGLAVRRDSLLIHAMLIPMGEAAHRRISTAAAERRGRRDDRAAQPALSPGYP